ncbi:putative transcriptional activator xlnr protein [Corynascus novoguineensis]|uniref:Transcriptional activator xlnr protein n=1 Tax=Corynascus novoguineensis TaxID=1126955 RepID=A0AAN7CK27_9PEZI|nr:putative transcriptional activator xlnr protein [Corynascus novoguineensis]
MSRTLACWPRILWTGLRYPVLGPLVPYLDDQISYSLACDLLDVYFQPQPQAPAHPLSPYVLGFVFRRQSFLQATPPRQCSPALLSSMLLVAAETSCKASSLIQTWRQRRQVCNQLKLITLAHIQMSAPLVSLDDVAALMHLGMVEVVDEQSRFWFHTACGLAEELGLGRELPPLVAPIHQSMDGNAQMEEIREERRRVWWLLYMVDRVFALYENRSPIVLVLDPDLLQPMDDAEYQNGDFHASRRRAPNFECNGRSIYAHLLPLMTILGEIMAQRYCPTMDNLIRHHLEVYETSLQRMRGEAEGSTGLLAESDTETQLVVAYGTYMARVLGILMTEEGSTGLARERHPSRSGTTAADVAAVFEDVSQILDLDPDLKFIQFFFGIFLFRGFRPLTQLPMELQPNRRSTLNMLSKIVTEFDIHYRVRAYSINIRDRTYC